MLPELPLVNAHLLPPSLPPSRSYYRAYADTEDSNGHGTHVSGTLVGMPYGTSLEAKPAGGYVGMAPDAKIAFIGEWGLWCRCGEAVCCG